MVDFGGLVDKAKQWAGKNPEKADGFVDKGSAAVKGRFAGREEQVDQVSQKAKDFLRGPQDGQPQPGQPQPGQPQPGQPQPGQAPPPPQQ